MNIDEMLAHIERGLEGVTPRLWVIFPHPGQKDEYFIRSVAWNMNAANAAHIARCNPDNMRAIIAHIRELEERAEKAERERDDAIKALSEQARLRGEAEGRLEASEMAGVVDGWKARAEAAEAANKRVTVALADFVAMGEQYEWDGSMTGRDILMKNARAALAAMEATDD